MKHPAQYTDAELASVLRSERLMVAQHVKRLKREIRDLVAELERQERNLHEIDQAEQLLS